MLTLGSMGAVLCTLSADGRHVVAHHCPALPARVVNCSGAGDCLVAGMVHALLQNSDPVAALAFGAAAAREAVESDANVPPGLTAAKVGINAKAAARSVQGLKLDCGCCCSECCEGWQM